MNNRINHQLQIAKDRNRIISSSFDQNPLRGQGMAKQILKSNHSKEDFILNFSKAMDTKKEYNSLLDKNLIGFYTKERFRRHLVKMELISQNGEILSKRSKHMSMSHSKERFSVAKTPNNINKIGNNPHINKVGGIALPLIDKRRISHKQNLSFVDKVSKQGLKKLISFYREKINKSISGIPKIQ